jgi:hypothetical protein
MEETSTKKVSFSIDTLIDYVQRAIKFLDQLISAIGALIRGEKVSVSF